MKTWDETIQYIRREPRYKGLVETAYFGTDVIANAERFYNSSEWKATVDTIKKYVPLKGAKVLDIGAGGGISSYAFIKEGCIVDAIEPDDSDTIGAAAIEKLATITGSGNLKVHRVFAENFVSEQDYDIVYARQSMHHAANLQQFVNTAYRELKLGGILVTTRDHVIKSEEDKQAFLKRHPLHKYYGGENAFSQEEYTGAMKKAGFTVREVMTPTGSDINLFPYTKEAFYKLITQKVPLLGNIPPVQLLAWQLYKYRLNRLPGHIYSFVAVK